jgi:ABC-type branched-subunit amino acid transport system ATPase component
MSAGSEFLTAAGVRRGFGGVQALDGAELAITAGQITCLIGPNGSGKTTLLNCLTGFTRVDAGVVRFRGHTITKSSVRRRARAGLRRTFQATRVFGAMTVLDHLLLAQQEFDETNWFDEVTRSPRLRRAASAATERAHEVLELVELNRPFHTPARDLSYGQQKLLGLACGLVDRPALLCLDEPLAGVNPALAERLITVLIEANRRGTTPLIVEHNIEFVAAISDQVVVMANGRCVVAGPPSILTEDQRVFAILSGTEEDGE